VRGTFAAGIASFWLSTFSAHADVLYTYQTSFFNPLHDASKPAAQSPADFFGLTFSSPFVLAPNSVYNISVAPSADYISSWTASDSLYGINLTGINAMISLVPYPGLIDGGGLTCGVGVTCFGGAIETDQTGHIVQWNLLATVPAGDPYLVFITYDSPGLGRTDALGFTQSDGLQLFQNNNLDGPTGIWLTAAVPEPSTWAMMILGFAGIGFMAYRRKFKPALMAV